MLIGWEACNYFINCTAVQLVILQTNKTAENKMAESYLNTKQIAREELKAKGLNEQIKH